MAPSTSAPTKSDPVADVDIRYDPLPGSKKVYVTSEADSRIKVPFREITLNPSVGLNDEREENAPIRLYDPSGPYTDPDASISINDVTVNDLDDNELSLEKGRGLTNYSVILNNLSRLEGETPASEPETDAGWLTSARPPDVEGHDNAPE